MVGVNGGEDHINRENYIDIKANKKCLYKCTRAAAIEQLEVWSKKTN